MRVSTIKSVASSETMRRGFTLIELSIVLVIIGLIVGGVLVGQDLIRASEIRATIAQIEKYNTAVNTFRGKYGALPGDLNQAVASAFGFSSRTTSAVAGQGDGNGVIEGSGPNGFLQGGETLIFWQDLTEGNPAVQGTVSLIEGSFTAYASPTVAAPSIVSSAIAQYFPPAKLGRGNSVYVYSTIGVNYFGIVNIVSTASGVPTVSPTMTVHQAYQIDKKIDDGYPVTGNVTATYDNGGVLAENSTPPPVNMAVSDSSSSCFNTSAGATPGAYSNSYSGGSAATCAVSFRFQ